MSENAVIALLKGPALQYVQHLRKRVDEDPTYLQSHKKEITPFVDQYLTRGGVIFDAAIVERDSISLVAEAIKRLRHIEKPPTP